MKSYNQKRGGARKGAGRPTIFGEPQKNVQVFIPVSKIDEFKKFLDELKEKWIINKTDHNEQN